MAWSSPMTAVAGNAITDADWNTNVRDNLLQTAPAKATANGGYFVATGANAIAERHIATAFIATAQSSSTASFIDLATAGPTVTVDTGSHALVLFKAHVEHTVTNAVSAISFQVSGATTISSTFNQSAQVDGVVLGNKPSMCGFKYVSLTPGTNTFKLQYYTGAATATFELREIVVIPL